MSRLEGRVGPQSYSDGSLAEARLGRSGEVAVQDAHGRYYEAAARGRMFYVAMQAGAALGTALTATAVTVSLWNPLGSGVHLSLVRATVGITAAPAGNAVLVYAVNNSPQLTNPSPATNQARPTRLGPAPGIGWAAFSMTLPVVPTVARVLGSVFATGSTAAVQLIDDIAGEIVLPENTIVTIQNIGVAISGIVTLSWEEISVT